MQNLKQIIINFEMLFIGLPQEFNNDGIAPFKKSLLMISVPPIAANKQMKR